MRACIREALGCFNGSTISVKVASVIRGWPWARVLFAAAVAGALGAVVITLAGGDVPWWGLVTDALALLASIGAGVFLAGSGLFAQPILAVTPARARNRLALTFDDGPDERHTRAVLDLLEARGHRGTFFVIGRRAEAAPELLAEMVRRGHGLGNHSFAHAYTTPFQHPTRLAADLARAQELMARAGARVRYFRPPIGLLSPRIADAAKRIGLTIVAWSASARDGRAGTTAAQAAARLTAAARPGAILVLHDAVERGAREPIAAAALPPLLDALAARGLRSVTLDELIDEENS
jgi:peptidoglycan/xylan/chitin deacetylase (PgdA/CDA1 family)